MEFAYMRILLMLVFCAFGNRDFGVQSALAIEEADPTMLVPESHGAIINEKEDTLPVKKSETKSSIHEIKNVFYNYRLNRDMRTWNGEQKSNTQYDKAANTNQGGNRVAQIQNSLEQSKPISSQSQLLKSAEQSQPIINQLQNGIGQSQNNNDQNSIQQSQQIDSQSQVQNGISQSQDINYQQNAINAQMADNSSVQKALDFYESIVQNAKALANKDNRGIQAIGFNNNEKDYTGSNDMSLDSTNKCLSPECKKVAKYIKNSMNHDADPCEDFYDFACGGWKKQNDIPESENEITSFTKLTKKIEGETHALLTAPPNPGESEALVKARKFFYSCTDTESIEKAGAKPALEFIEAVNGWSMCGNKEWTESKWNVYDVLKKIQSTYYPAPPFFTVEVTNDHLNSTKHLIKIDQSGLSLQREIYVTHPEIVENYEEYMVQIVKLLGYNCDNVTEEVKEIIEFEQQLAKITTPAEAKQAGTFRRINLKILKSLIPHFPWEQHLKHIFQNEAKIRELEVILSTSPLYLYEVARKIKEVPKRILSKYIVWQMLRDKISFLSKAFRKARATFNKKMTGVEDNDPRWRTCTSVTNDNMGVPIGTLYVENYFKESTKEKTHEMIGEIIKSFESRIKKHKWIDSKTRKGILDKTAALVAKVGYATYIRQPDELNKRFKKLQIGDSFFVNNLNVDKWIRTRLFGKLRKPVDKTKWPMFPQTINAMYQFYENEIVIPAGILQEPFYYEGDVPRSLSYGAIGSIIGHELTHGFDNTGRKFDKNGDIVKEWWSQGALKEFQKRATCIQKQYSKYKVQDKYPVSGKLTLGENIADNGGTKLAYDAYMDWLEKSGLEQTLPGLDYTNKQLFFIGYAQEYCANVRKKTEYIATLSEIHAPSKFRVIGTLSNFDAFSETFQCRKRSRMNPEVKCEVW